MTEAKRRKTDHKIYILLIASVKMYISCTSCLHGMSWPPSFRVKFIPQVSESAPPIRALPTKVRDRLVTSQSKVYPL